MLQQNSALNFQHFSPQSSELESVSLAEGSVESTDPLRSFHSQDILGKCSTPFLPSIPFSLTISTDFCLTDYLIEVWGFLNSLHIFF